MFEWIVFALAITLVVLYHYLTRNDEDREEEPSFKEQMLMGTSVGSAPKTEKDEEANPEEEETEKSFMERVYSGKAPQAKYVRYIAGHERHRAIEAARLADEKEKEEEHNPSSD